VLERFTGRPIAFRPLYERLLHDEEAIAAGSIALARIAVPVLRISGTGELV